MNKRLTGVLVFCFCVMGLSAQLTWERNVLATSGSTFSSGSLSLNTTLGESFVGSLTPGANILTANLGFQQGDLMLTGLEAWTSSGLPRVYPNPFHQLITIDVPVDQHGQLRLVDARGRILHFQEIPPSTSVSIPLADLPAGPYVLEWLDLEADQTTSLILIKQ